MIFFPSSAGGEGMGALSGPALSLSPGTSPASRGGEHTKETT